METRGPKRRRKANPPVIKRHSAFGRWEAIALYSAGMLSKDVGLLCHYSASAVRHMAIEAGKTNGDEGRRRLPIEMTEEERNVRRRANSKRLDQLWRLKPHLLDANRRPKRSAGGVSVRDDRRAPSGSAIPPAARR